MDYLVGEECIPISVACSAVGLSRASYYKKPAGLREKDQPVMDALNQVVGKNGRWGFGLCLPIYAIKVIPGTTNGFGGSTNRWG